VSSARRFTAVYSEVEPQPHRHITELAQEVFFSETHMQWAEYNPALCGNNILGLIPFGLRIAKM